jgi:hypothetical protein
LIPLLTHLSFRRTVPLMRKKLSFAFLDNDGEPVTGYQFAPRVHEQIEHLRPNFECVCTNQDPGHLHDAPKAETNVPKLVISKKVHLLALNSQRV